MRFVIIGCGHIGKKRAQALKTMGEQVVMACDLKPEAAADLARAYPGCKTSTDPLTAVQTPDADVVIVATLNRDLCPLSLRALQAGKHVIVEKPAGVNSQELIALEKEAIKRSLQVRVGFNHRYHPAFLKAREIVGSGALGRLMFIRARYGHGGRVGYEKEWRANPQLSGGGELMDQGVHLIDLSGMFLGEFTEIGGRAYNCFWDMGVDDNAFLHLVTAQKQTAWLHVSCSEWKNIFSFELYGEKGKLQIEGLGGSYGVERLIHYRMLPEMGPPETVIEEYPRGDDSWKIEMQEFVEDIRLKRVPSAGLKEAIRAMRVVESIYQQGIEKSRG